METLILVIRGHRIISLNNAYNYARFKTKDTLTRLEDIKRQVNTRSKDIREFVALYRPREHFVKIDYEWFVPEEDFFNASKTSKTLIKSTRGDWSNFPKLPDDLIMNEILGIDDSQIVRGTVTILPYPRPTDIILVKLKLGYITALKDAWRTMLPEGLR